MKIFKYLIIGLILLSINNVYAAETTYNTLGIYTPNNANTIKWVGGYDVQSELYYARAFYWDTCTCDGYLWATASQYDYSTSSTINQTTGGYCYCGTKWSKIKDYKNLLGHYDYLSLGSQLAGDVSCFDYSGEVKTTIYFYAVSTDIFTISGTTCGIDNVSLYHGGTALLNYDDLTDDAYSFNITDNTMYTLNFSDGHGYEFTVDGSNINYDYSICDYITLNFKDNCGNLLRETVGYYWYPALGLSLPYFSTSTGNYDILFENQPFLKIWAYSTIGDLAYNISSPQDISYTILNNKIAWHNNIFVRDGNTSMIIEDALVTFSQDCIIDTSLYPVRQKYSNVDGYACFDQCELDMAYIDVTATGYKSLSDSISSIHLNVFNLGQTTIATLYPIDDPTNESALTESGTIATTYIYFKDNSSHYTNSILDTDEYVDLYYFNNNSESASMTLKFQKYNIYTGLFDILSWNIPHDTSGYKRIYNANFTDHTYSYYGYLYNVEIDGWNRRTRLSVRNKTKEVIDHYQNLSTILWFENKNPQGDIDYREDMNIIAYANSDNSSLLEISLELYNNSIYVDHTNLSWADFISADTKYYYEWNPDHSYVNGYNYTVDMRGYDYYLLETDYINASDFRKNKLTIIVKDWIGNNLTNSYIYLEGYGSLSTGINYYNSYEGLDNAEYRYKASKSGYSDYGWDIINLDSSDEIVIYTLTGYDSTGAVISEKIDDTELSTVFYTLIFFLFIVILIAALNWLCIKCK